MNSQDYDSNNNMITFQSPKKKSVDKTFDLTLSLNEEEEDFTSKKKIGKKQVCFCEDYMYTTRTNFKY